MLLHILLSVNYFFTVSRATLCSITFIKSGHHQVLKLMGEEIAVFCFVAYVVHIKVPSMRMRIGLVGSVLSCCVVLRVLFTKASNALVRK
jgi:hypothetical protein